MKDNQGRDLEATKRHFDLLSQLSKQGHQMSQKAFEEKLKKHPLADWTTVEGVLVLRCGKSRFVGVPKNGKKTAANFDVIDLEKRELVVQLKKNEVASWLWRVSLED